jgi:hypothetical protein
VRHLGTLLRMFKRIRFLKTTTIFTLARLQEFCTGILFFDCISVAVVAYQPDMRYTREDQVAVFETELKGSSLIEVTNDHIISSLSIPTYPANSILTTFYTH